MSHDKYKMKVPQNRKIKRVIVQRRICHSLSHFFNPIF